MSGTSESSSKALLPEAILKDENQGAFVIKRDGTGMINIDFGELSPQQNTAASVPQQQ